MGENVNLDVGEGIIEKIVGKKENLDIIERRDDGKIKKM